MFVIKRQGRWLKIVNGFGQGGNKAREVTFRDFFFFSSILSLLSSVGGERKGMKRKKGDINLERLSYRHQ